jgi:hypothetical protein
MTKITLFQLGIILNVVLVSFHRDPTLSMDQFTVLIDEWQHHAAAVGVFLVWGELMLMIGRLPTFGIYVQVGGKLEMLILLVPYIRYSRGSQPFVTGIPPNQY